MTYLSICLFSSLVILTGCIDNVSSVNNKENITVRENITQEGIIIGDLGGVPVEIPANSVRLVEYNGDPDWGESFEGAVPERTYESKISSFGFDVSYTDGALYDGIVGELSDEYEAQKNLSDSTWVSVGVNSGNRYYGSGGIDRIGQGTINARPDEIPVYTYEKLPETQFGLEVYVPPGMDPKTNTPWREDRDAEDMFIQRDKNGTITTYIECSNRDVEQPPLYTLF